MLGNTLAHVGDAHGLAQALQHMRATLNPGGLLCIQVINYDSLLTEGARWLPLIARQRDDREYIFLREHRCTGQTAEFTVITLIRAAGQWTQHVARDQHLPLPRDLLCPALEHAGFAPVMLLGSYAGDAFAPDASPSCILLARGE